RALGRVALGVGERRAQDALGVDALVGPEAAVLGGHGSGLHRVGDLGERDRLAVLVGELTELGLAVLVVDERGLGLVGLVLAWDRRLLVGEVEDRAHH